MSTTYTKQEDGNRSPDRRPRQASSCQRLLTLQQAAAESGVPATSLRELIARGALAEVRLPTMRRVWIDRRDLNVLIERAREVRS